MALRKLPLLAALVLSLSACGEKVYDPRGVDHDETLLSVSATGQNETRPDRAEFQAGINTWDRSAEAAGAANRRKIEEIVAALRGLGIDERDIQTRALSIQRVEWGDRKGQFLASNVVNVTVRKVESAGAAVAAVTGAGANILSGPDLRMSDPEKAANSAYGNAYRAARSRAEAYAKAAGMKVSRVLSIRDAGGTQGNRYLPGAVPAPPPRAVMAEQASDSSAASIMPGQTNSSVAVQVDFALEPK
jgi:uncharacterized protein YggE